MCNNYSDYPDRVSTITSRALQVHADPESLSRVLDNLVSNAIHYTNRQPIEVRLTQNDRHACISVRDYGPGIPEQELNRMLQPFVRLENENEGTGSGLGMSIANLICKQQGRELTLEPASQLGLKTSIKIPLP